MVHPEATSPLQGVVARGPYISFSFLILCRRTINSSPSGHKKWRIAWSSCLSTRPSNITFFFFFLQMTVSFFFKPPLMIVATWNRFWRPMKRHLANNSIERKPHYFSTITFHKKLRSTYNTFLEQRSSGSMKPTWDYLP